MNVAELLRQVRELEITARKNVTSALVGNYTTAIRGRGLDFHEARKYTPGDDTRQIDWNMTARCGEPYVRVHLDEREREVFLALDVSPSMHVGWQDRTKLEYAVEMAATLAVSAVEQKDKLGYVLFADGVVDFSPPRRGQEQLFRTLKAMLLQVRSGPRSRGESDLRLAIHAIQRLKGRRFVIFLLSDFIERDVPEDFRYVQSRHDVSLLHVYDPVEYIRTRAVFFPAFAPEGRTRLACAAPGCGGSLEELHAFLKAEGEKYRMTVHSFPTRAPVAASMRYFLHLKRRTSLL